MDFENEFIMYRRNERLGGFKTLSSNRRASDEQKEYLVDFMSRNVAFANNIRQQNLKSAAAKKYGREGLWGKLTAELNALPGANKNVAKWKKCWIDMRLHAKAKYKQFRHRSENGELHEVFGKECLTDLDARIIKILSSCLTRPRISNLARVKTRSQYKDAPVRVETTEKHREEETIDDFINIPENVAVKVEIVEGEENECRKEPIYSNSSLRPDYFKQPLETFDDTFNKAKTSQKTTRKRKRNTIYKKITNEIASLKSTLLKDIFQYKQEKIAIERQKVHLEAERMQLEKEKFEFEKYSTREKLKIESQKVQALVSISNAINIVAEKSTVFSVTEDLDEVQESETEI